MPVQQEPKPRGPGQPMKAGGSTQTMRFRLKAGQVIMADYSQEPIIIPYTDRFGRPQQQVKYPSKTYNVGDVIESEDDLALKHGEDKFQRLEPRGMRGLRKGQQVAPPAIHPTLPQQPRDSSRREGMAAEQKRQFEEQLGVSDSGREAEDPRVREGRSLDEPVHETDESQQDPRFRNQSTTEKEVKRDLSSMDEDSGTRADDLPNLEQSQNQELDEMTVHELRAFAEDNEVDLAGCRTKADILETIKESRKNKGR